MKNNEMIKFKVQNGVPLPFARGGNGRKYDWPFGTMKKGQCFFVPLKDSSFSEIYSAMTTVAKDLSGSRSEET